MNAITTYSSPQADTGYTAWAAVLDTTLSTTVADSEFVLIYANLPGKGFTQLPARAEYVTGDLTDVTDQLNQYSVSLQRFYLPVGYNQPIASLGDTARKVYAGYIGTDAEHGYFTFTTLQNGGEVHAHTLVSSSLNFDPNTEYAQQLRSSGATFPLDSDLSTPEEELYRQTTGSGELTYDESTNQVGALKDSIGSDLDVQDVNWDIFKASDQSDYFVRPLKKNPRERTVQLAGQWSPDSITVSGYMSGTNVGNDHTAYVNTFPLEIRVVIVAGNTLAKRNMGKQTPYAQIEALIR